ncbi:MAG: 4'-phosphopantetheinyl transferase superfamily protein [Verrucomicrobiales bacterium]|nr:4'-phosphopantetheinyl transferase superfamily protein [Verrucomicrobiales bacterium]
MRTLVDNEIEVTGFDLDEGSSLPVQLAETWLSAEELERAAAFKFPVHRDRYIRGRGMVRKCLSGHLGSDPGALKFVLGDKGKPHLAGDELHFNLSHSEEKAALAISRLPAIGIDIEQFDRKVDIPGLSRRCFRDSEISRLEGLQGEALQRAFFWTWTAKEARMKATGEGFGLEPGKIEISFEGEWPDRCLAPSDPQVYVSAVRLVGFHSACTVAATNPFEVRIVSTLPE